MIILVIFIGLMALVILLVSANLNSTTKDHNYLPVFLRIMLNHFQVLTLVANFDFHWPEGIQNFYKNLQPVADA